MLRRNAVLVSALVALGSMFAATSAHAYLLPTEALTRLIAENRKMAAVRDITLQLNADLANHDHQIDERLYLKRYERSRLVQQDDAVLVTVDREATTAVGDDKALKVVGSSSNLLPMLLFPKGKDIDETAARLLHNMQSIGIDTKVVALGRLNDVVAYVIGAHPWETNKAQLWLQKETLLPVRVIVVKKNDATPSLWESRYLEYGNGPGGPNLPRIFEDYQDGKLMRHAEVVSVQFNQDLPETLFEWSTSIRRRP